MSDDTIEIVLGGLLSRDGCPIMYIKYPKGQIEFAQDYKDKIAEFIKKDGFRVKTLHAYYDRNVEV